MSRAFSMVELVIVVVIVGIVAAIAVPRFGGMAERARERRLVADLGTLQRAAELFRAEHLGLDVADNPAGGLVDADVLTARLVGRTDRDGRLNPSGLFGPYLREMPENALNGLSLVRIDGAAAGAGTAGWRYDSARDIFQSDEAFEAVMPDGTLVDHVGAVKGAVGGKLKLGADD